MVDPFAIGFAGAAAAGLASFASPCILPIVPPYLCFLAGVSLDELTDRRDSTGDNTGQSAGQNAGQNAGRRWRIVVTAAVFALGFATIFVALGASASLIGQTIAHHYDVMRWIAGGVILAFGLHFLGILRIPILYRRAQAEVQRRPTGLFGAYLVGLAFGFGWTPCVGPVLATILFTAGAQQTAGQGALLLAAYAAGIAVPFIAAAAFAGPFIALMRGMRRQMALVERGVGAALVVTGILFITNSINDIAAWMIPYVPVTG
ncbi:MAG: cytochrome c biogenesis protein CcdA [Pseudomonadota bacterium]